MSDIQMVPALNDFEIHALKRDIERGRWRRRVPITITMRALASIGAKDMKIRALESARANLITRLRSIGVEE